MSGCSAQDAIYLADEETPEQHLQHDFDDQIYAPDSEDEDGDGNFDDDVELLAPSVETPPDSTPCPTRIEVSEVSWECGVIRCNDVVELHMESAHDPGTLHSGDFLLVRAIIEDLETGIFMLRGYRMRRNRYYRPMFGSTSQEFSDLFMLLDVDLNRNIPTWIQGLEDVEMERVLRKRNCAFTSMSAAAFGVRQVNAYRDRRLYPEYSDAQFIFHMGTLIVRHVHIRERRGDGTPYGGVVRRLYKRETVEFSRAHLSSLISPNVSAHGMRSAHTSSKDQTRAQSIEVQESLRKSSNNHLPNKPKVYRLGDCFCGIGGTSLGAQKAGWHIAFGLDNDPKAMKAYRKNFPGAQHLEMDAHDFAFTVDTGENRPDMIHLSCPCQFWSENHTVEGKDDEKNMLAIYTADAIVGKFKPRLFSMEQAPGLIRSRKHWLHFRGLVGRLLEKSYNVRYTVQDQAWFGLPQHRRRLIFVGAKIGTPLPPMPKPVHGPAETGLQRYKTVKDALRPLTRQELRVDDKYHQPHREPRMNVQPKDPDTIIANCVTGSGGDNAHHTGTRPNTPRELGLLQGLPCTFHLEGSKTSAKIQIGNVWSTGERYFRLWAATLEAFDNGLIDQEEDIEDLYETLEQKQVDFGKSPPIDVDSPRLGGTHRNLEPKYRYISKLEKTVQPKLPLTLWSQDKNVEPRTMPAKKAKSSRRPVVGEAEEIDRLRSLSIAPRSVSVEIQSSRPGSGHSGRGKKRSRTENPSGRDDKRFQPQKRTKSDSAVNSHKKIVYEISDDEE